MINIDQYVAKDFGRAFLADIIGFISINFEIDDVFDDDTIKNFIERNDFAETHCTPGMIFSVGALEKWAIENGFVEKE